jgi:plasmid stability protein
MPTNLHIREVPDPVHAALVARARRRGMSLRQYTIQVLEDHCALPALGDWLDGLAALPPVEGAPAAEAVERSREEDDREVLRGRRGA